MFNCKKKSPSVIPTPLYSVGQALYFYRSNKLFPCTIRRIELIQDYTETYEIYYVIDILGEFTETQIFEKKLSLTIPIGSKYLDYTVKIKF